MLPAALVFDFDGVIIDTESVELAAIREVWSEHGHELDPEEWATTVGTTQEHDWIGDLAASLGREVDRDSVAASRRRHVARLVGAQPIRPGVTELLTEALSAGVPCAVASNSSHRWVDGHLRRVGLRSFFTTLVTVDRVRSPKPSPEPYLTAVAEVGASPRCSVAIEDSTTGVASAVAAGLLTVAVPGPLTLGHDFRAADVLLATLSGLTLAALGRALVERRADPGGP